MLICSVEGCDKKAKIKGMCEKHYRKVLKHGDPLYVNPKHKHTDICSIEGCNNKYIAKGFCDKHYKRFQVYGDPLYVNPKYDKKYCTIKGCNGKHFAKGLCQKHYARLLKHGDPLYINPKYNKKYCKIKGCNNEVKGLGLCQKHYQRLKKHGDPLYKPKNGENEHHGMSNIPEYMIWKGMKARCYNSKNKFYYCYGGRGITVCKRWLHSFTAFYADMGKRPTPKHQIDRTNNNGNYEPSNCRWVTATENVNNRRISRKNK